MDHISHALGVSGDALRRANLYKEGQTTPYGDIMTPCYIEDMWNEMRSSSQYERRSAEIQKFNKVIGDTNLSVHTDDDSPTSSVWAEIQISSPTLTAIVQHHLCGRRDPYLRPHGKR